MFSFLPRLKRLSRSLTHRGGRNDTGRITNFHVGGGAKKRGPITDFSSIPSCSILLDTVKMGRRSGPLSLFYHLFPSTLEAKVLSKASVNCFPFIFYSFFRLGFRSFSFLPIKKMKGRARLGKVLSRILRPYSTFMGRMPFRRILPPVFQKSVNWVRNSLANFNVSSQETYANRYFLNRFKSQFSHEYSAPRGFFSYRVSTQFIGPRDVTFTGHQSPPVVGNRLPLVFVPNGTNVHSVPFSSGRENTFFSLSGKSSSRVLAKYVTFSLLSLPSGEHRIVPSDQYVTVGSPTSFLYTGYRFHKAGHSRWRGIRPKTRGVATNPVDHPHGGRTQRGRPARSFAFSSIKFLSLVNKLINFLSVRSSWKGNFYAPPILRLHNRLSREGISSDFKGVFYNRSSTVPPPLRGYQFSLFLGKDFIDGGIRREMVGFRFGEFFVTKRLGSRIHVAKKAVPAKSKPKTQK
jgi:ribosomal protein L2/ribosomal protein S19